MYVRVAFPTLEVVVVVYSEGPGKKKKGTKVDEPWVWTCNFPFEPSSVDPQDQRRLPFDNGNVDNYCPKTVGKFAKDVWPGVKATDVFTLGTALCNGYEGVTLSVGTNEDGSIATR